MASKTAPLTESERAKIHEEFLEDLEKTLDRLKAMYEQYFLGIAKVAPGPLHAEVERKIRDLTQANIRQTRLRYRFVTQQQKFASYNSYWRRTLREIEGGRYIRNLSKIGREAISKGAEIPEEILAAMPKRMREQVIKDRDAAIARAGRRKVGPNGDFVSEDSTQEDGFLELGAGEPSEAPLYLDDDDVPAQIREPVRRTVQKAAPNRPHQLSKDDEEFDLDAFFSQVQSEPEPEQVWVKSAPTAPKLAPQVDAQPGPARISGTQPVARPSSPPAPPARRSGATIAPAQEPPITPVPPATLPGVARIQTRAQPPVISGQPRPGTPPVAPPPGPGPARLPTRPMGVVPPPESPPAGTRTMPGLQPTKPLIAQPPQARPPAPPPIPTQPMPRMPSIPTGPASQRTRPLTVQPGSTTVHPAPPVQTMSFKRTDAPAPPLRPPPGMSDADVNVLHANYIKAKQLVGEDAGPGSRDKLLRTINAQAPKIMDQYKADAVDFSVVVKDNQVIIRAKPKSKL